MRNPGSGSAAAALLAAINAAENPPVGDDSGEFKTANGWAREWEVSGSYSRILIKRACDAGLMETRKEYRNVGQVSRATPVYRLCPPKTQRHGKPPRSKMAG